MVFSIKKIAVPFSWIFLTFLLCACSPGNALRLNYSTAGTSEAPKADAPKVCVLVFEDARGKADIGQRADGSPYTPKSSVTDWISHALAEELTRLGLQVSYATSPAQAESSGADFIIKGSVEEIWLAEVSSTSFTCSLRVKIGLYNKNRIMFTDVYSSSMSKRVIPFANPGPDILSETLNDLVRPAAIKINAQIR